MHAQSARRPRFRSSTDQAFLYSTERDPPTSAHQPLRAHPHGGVRIAIFYTKVYNRLLVPLTAADQTQALPELRTALATITHHVDDYADRTRHHRTA